MKSKPIKRKNESTAETRLRWLNRISAAVLVLSLFIVYSIIAIRATGTLTPTMELLDGHAAIRFVDVGQGDCTLVTHRGHAVLIDAGPTSNAQATAETVRMYAPRIDAFFVTHPHEDHMGGAEAVLNACRVENLILPDAESGEGFTGMRSQKPSGKARRSSHRTAARSIPSAISGSRCTIPPGCSGATI